MTKSKVMEKIGTGYKIVYFLDKHLLIADFNAEPYVVAYREIKKLWIEFTSDMEFVLHIATGSNAYAFVLK